MPKNQTVDVSGNGPVLRRIYHGTSSPRGVARAHWVWEVDGKTELVE